MNSQEFLRATGLQFPVTINEKNLIEILDHHKKVIQKHDLKLIEDFENNDAYESGAVDMSDLFANQIQQF